MTAICKFVHNWQFYGTIHFQGKKWEYSVTYYGEVRQYLPRAASVVDLGLKPNQQ